MQPENGHKIKSKQLNYFMISKAYFANFAKIANCNKVVSFLQID